MDPIPSPAWNPDRRWADPLIATLALVILLLAGDRSRLRHALPPRIETQVGLQGRLEDLLLAAPKVLGQLTGKSPAGLKPPPPPAAVAANASGGWDRALRAVHEGERKDLTLGASLAAAAPGETGVRFRQAWTWAYQGTGSAPDAESLRQVTRALGNGYAARILEARVRARSGETVEVLEKAAQAWVLPRLLGLIGAGFGGFLLALAGVAFGIFLLLKPARPAPLPRYRLSGRALLLVLLGWFLTLMAAGSVVGALLALLPFLRPIGLPLVYGFHAAWGTAFLCMAEGLTLAELWRPLCPGRSGRALATGLGFFAVAFAAVMAVALLLSPLLRNAEPPQKELLEMLSNLKGFGAVALTFLTVAAVAPVFEELLFRGFLLPWLGERLERRFGPRSGWLLAIAATGVTFAAIHLQPLGLPTLSTLGIVLGFAYVRTGNLGTAILVHGLWNGSVFILMRLLAGA